MSTTAESESSPRHRAVVLQGRGKTSLETLPRPSPAPGEILLRLRCCGLCGTDLFKITQDTPPIGRVLGHELVGTVAELGEGVESFSVGDRVVTPHHVPCGHCHLCLHDSQTLCRIFREDLIVPGGFSEYFVVRSRAVEHAAHVVPDSVSDSVAMFLEPAACVLRGIERAGLPAPGGPLDPGITALILGAGSMGLLHLLVLRSLFADLEIVVSDPLPHRRELARRFGAQTVVSPDGLDQRVAELTRGRGADCVFDTVGRPDALRQAIGASREGATVVLFAHARPGAELNWSSTRSSNRSVIWWEPIRVDPQSRPESGSSWSGGASIPPHSSPTDCRYRDFEEGVDLALNHDALKVVFVPDEEFGPEPA